MLVHINSLCWFCHALFFQSKCAKEWYRDISGCVLHTFKWFSMAKSAKKFRCEHYSFKVRVQWCCSLWKNIVGHTEISVFACICVHFQKLIVKMQYFLSTLQAELNTLIKSSTFKGKCTVNTENFICNLYVDWPFNEYDFKGQGTIFKERAFQQCTAT